MIYNWTQIGIKEITSLYLYKQMATPSDLTNETIIRPKDVSETMRYGADIEVDMFTYMTTGPGRFALGSESAMVQAFFSTVSDLSWMEPGKAYKKADLISHLQLDPKSDRITIRQVELADAASDYWQRSYIWNSGLFKLSDDVTFTIDAEGKRSINNYSVRPFNEDFDFEGGGIIAAVANSVLEAGIDPWKIGRKVNINFVDGGMQTKTYTAADISSETLRHISHVVSGAVHMTSGHIGLAAIQAQLWDGGVTKYLYKDKAIIYGTPDSDVLSEAQLNDLPLVSQLKSYGQSNGVALIADGGNDTLTGGSKSDYLQGGSGADTLEGKDGADYLEGGADADTYVLQTGLTGIDTLVDSGSNTLQVGGKTVSGAFAQVAGMGGDIYYSADKSYQLRKAENGVWRLSAKNAGTGQYSAVADLKNWKDGDYGLSIGAPTQEPERVPAVVYPNSVAYLAMDGAAAPKGVTFGGGTKSDSFNGSAHDDVITTGGGLSNYVMAFSGDDMVVGGDGRDFIRTGQNASSPTFKDNDIGFGGEHRDVLMGGGGDDQLWGEYIDSANEAAGADSGEYGDWVSGELGNDTINGSKKGDVLFGGAGRVTFGSRLGCKSLRQRPLQAHHLQRRAQTNPAPHAPSMRLAGVNGLEEGMASGRGFL